jgi:hypothetical protein
MSCFGNRRFFTVVTTCGLSFTISSVGYHSPCCGSGESVGVDSSRETSRLNARKFSCSLQHHPRHHLDYHNPSNDANALRNLPLNCSPRPLPVLSQLLQRGLHCTDSPSPPPLLLATLVSLCSLHLCTTQPRPMATKSLSMSSSAASCSSFTSRKM